MITAQFIIKNLKDKREVTNFTLFSLGKFISIFGTAIYSFAIGLHVLKITGSGLNFATTLIISTVPRVVIYPFAGVLADRINKKLLVVTMDLLNGILLVLIYYLSTVYGLRLLMIYAGTFIMSVLTAFFDISLEAAKPNLVSEKALMNINSVSRVIDSTSSILGPMVGGIIFAFVDIKVFIVINGLSFIFSGISEMFIDFQFNYKKEITVTTKVDFLRDIKEGFQYIINKENIIRLFSTFVALNFFLGFSVSVPLPYIINNELYLEPSYFGIIQGAFPAGMIAGALLVGRIAEIDSYSRVLTRAAFVLSFCMIAIGLPLVLQDIKFSGTVYLLYYCIVMGVMGVAISFIDIPIAYMVQKTVPEEYRGRVFSIGISIVKIILPAALVMSGFLLNIVPAYFVTIPGGILLILFSLFILKG